MDIYEVNEIVDMRHPDETLALLDGIQGTLDWVDDKNGVKPRYDMLEILWGVIRDILDSVRLAESDDVKLNPTEIHDTVLDYVTNHYPTNHNNKGNR